MENQIYHLVYLTTNLTNGKIYVGVHSTEVLEDEYLGSGRDVCKAVKKYGKENFKRDILYFCLTDKDAYLIESQIVDVWFVKRKDTYNLTLGGFGGNTIINYSEKELQNRSKKISKSLSGLKRTKEQKEITKQAMIKVHKNRTTEEKEEISQKISEANRNRNFTEKQILEIVEKRKDTISKKSEKELLEISQKISKANKGRKQSEEHIKKRVETRKLKNNFKHTEESRKKLSEANKGKKLSKESIEKREQTKKLNRINKLKIREK